MVGNLPARIPDRPLAHLHDAVAGGEPNRLGGLYQFDVRPLEAMPVDVIGDLAKQDAFRPEDAIRFGNERRATAASG